MKKKHIVFILMGLLIIAGTFRAGTVYGAGTSKPGSAGDPLVTLSYLEKRLGNNNSGGTTSGYAKVSISKNKTLFLKEGSEAVLYSGSATVIGRNGLINLSSGELFKTNFTVVKYQIFLSPDNNSGLKANANTTVFVKGDYTIK